MLARHLYNKLSKKKEDKVWAEAFFAQRGKTVREVLREDILEWLEEQDQQIKELFWVDYNLQRIDWKLLWKMLNNLEVEIFPERPRKIGFDTVNSIKGHKNLQIIAAPAPEEFQPGL